MIIWGFRWMKRVLGQLGPYTCQRCHNAGMWQVIRMTRFFTLFFIPVFPVRRDYSLLCPICSHGSQITKEQYEQLEASASPTLA